MQPTELMISGVSVASIVVLVIELLLKPALPKLQGWHWLLIAIALTMALGLVAVWLTAGWPATPEAWATTFMGLFVYALAVGKGYDEVKTSAQKYKAAQAARAAR